MARRRPAYEFERANIPDIEVLSWLAEKAAGWWHWEEGAKNQRLRH